MNRPVSHHSKDRILQCIKAGLLLFTLFGLLPGQAFGQTLTCNSSFAVTIGIGSSIFIGDPVPISVDIGAGVIDGGTLLEVDQLTFGPDCDGIQGINTCTSPGNAVTFNGISSTTCEDASGTAVTFGATPGPGPAEVIFLTPNNPIRNFETGTTPPSSCNISFSVTVDSLADPDAPGGDTVEEAFGWNLPNGFCDNGQFASEDNSFSIRVSVPEIDIEKSTNGVDADTPTGPVVTVGSTVNWEYVVENTGNEDLTNVTVSDDQGVTVTCPQSTLAVGESMTCTASGAATEGQYANVGTATGMFETVTVSDTDPSHYLGVLPSIQILKEISIDGGNNYFDANDAISAPVASVPSSALYRITVTNTGTVALENVAVSDDSIAGPAWPFNVGTLAPAEVFVIDSGVINALFVEDRCTTAGTFTNVASVSANPVGFSNIPVSDEDPANLRCIQVDVAVPANQPMALLLLILGMSTMAAFVIRRTI